jgi:hypothetical protein
MGVFAFRAEDQSQNGDPEILVGYRGMGFRNGADVYFTNTSIRATGEIEIRQYGRATAVGRMSYDAMKAGASFTVEGLGTVRVGVRKLLLGLVEAIDVHCNDVRWKGHELVHYRGIGVT